ncbi:MAG: Rieske 2Fe-2S domain-containing protein [Candidatus Promineifilaceae bacterium]
MAHKTSKRSFFQRLLGKPITGAPADAGCWQLQDGMLSVDLGRAPELASPYGAINLEDTGLPARILVLRDGENRFHAFENACAHAGRQLDPVAGTETVCCCSLGKSLYYYNGHPVDRPDLGPIKVFPVTVDGESLTIDLG